MYKVFAPVTVLSRKIRKNLSSSSDSQLDSREDKQGHVLGPLHSLNPTCVHAQGVNMIDATQTHEVDTKTRQQETPASISARSTAPED